MEENIIISDGYLHKKNVDFKIVTEEYINITSLENIKVNI